MAKAVNPMGLNGAPGLTQNLNSNPIQTQNQQQQPSQQLQLQLQQTQPNQLGSLQQASQQRQSAPGALSNSGMTDRSPANFGESQRIGMGIGSLAGMSESDRFGLNGLTEMIKGDHQDMAMLALGTDLTQLGLDLSQPEYYTPTFASRLLSDELTGIAAVMCRYGLALHHHSQIWNQKR